jgi:hypothetical protein
MEMKEYNILVIGLGNVGFQYDLGRKKTVLTHIKGLRIASQLMGIKINIQAVENNSSQRTLFQSYFPSYKVHESVDSITESNFDLAIICCTTSSILEMYTSVCKKLNVTKIIVEKPVVTNLNTYKLFENILKCNIETRIGFPRRTVPSTTYLKQLVQNNSNEVQSISLNLFGETLNIGLHFLDLIEFIFGKFKIVDFKTTGGLLNFYAKGEFFDLTVNQRSLVNNEKTYFLAKGKFPISYLNAGRNIQIGDLTMDNQLSINSSSEIENMIGFEALDYLTWISTSTTTNLPKIIDTPIFEILQMVDQL